MSARIHVPEPTFDSSGYPTETTLRIVKRWAITGPDDCDALLAFVHKAWRYPDYMRRQSHRRRAYSGASLRRRWFVSTGGWSGNEELIGALMANRLFWMFSWVSSRRGGHYVFEV